MKAMINQNDSLRSLISGLGDPSRDKASSTYYSPTLLLDDQLYNAYSNSWIARKIVDIPAFDALRKGRDWQAEQAAITKIEAEEKRLNLWGKLLQCVKMARLWGGAALFIGSRDTDLAQPFNPEQVTLGGLPYLTVLTRRDLSVVDLEQDPLSEFWGRPSMYRLTRLTKGTLDIHPSRLVIQIGAENADPWLASGSSYGWGDSVLQAAFSAVSNADSTAANIASLVFEANVDVFGIPGLMEQLGSDSYRQKLLDRFTLAAAGKSITKALLRDSEEEYTRHPAQFAGLPDIIQQFLLMVAGAADIPLTRFLGQTPSGLSTTGEGDMKNYYDKIQSVQTLEIKPTLHRLDEALIRSALGSRPDDIFYTWAPLEQINEEEQASIGLKYAQTAEILDRTGLFTGEELRKTVGNQLVESGLYPGLGEVMTETGEGFDPDLTESAPDNEQLSA